MLKTNTHLNIHSVFSFMLVICFSLFLSLAFCMLNPVESNAAEGKATLVYLDGGWYKNIDGGKKEQQPLKFYYSPDSITSNRVTIWAEGGADGDANTGGYGSNAFAYTWSSYEEEGENPDLSDNVWLIMPNSDNTVLEINDWTIDLYIAAAKDPEIKAELENMKLKPGYTYAVGTMRMGDSYWDSTAVTWITNADDPNDIGWIQTLPRIGDGEEQSNIWVYINEEWQNPNSEHYNPYGIFLMGTGGDGDGTYFFYYDTEFKNDIELPDKNSDEWLPANGTDTLSDSLIILPEKANLPPNSKIYVWCYKGPSSDGKYGDSAIAPLYSSTVHGAKQYYFTTPPKNELPPDDISKQQE